MSRVHVEILNQAIKEQRSNRCEFICHTLDSYQWSGGEKEYAATQIKESIATALGGSASLRTWLGDVHSIKDISYKQMRNYRIRFIKECLIPYWKDK